MKKMKQMKPTDYVYQTCECGKSIMNGHLKKHKKMAFHFEKMIMIKSPEFRINIYQCEICGTTIEGLTLRERENMPPKTSPNYPKYTQAELKQKAENNGLLGKHECSERCQKAKLEGWNKIY